MNQFKILKQSKKNNARTGIFKTAHGEFKTPAFMSVGTVGAVKGIAPWELKEIGAEVVLSNTYHLYLRPGEKLIKKMGGIHKFIGWDGPILTDSGGFQVFSLGAGRKGYKFGELDVPKAEVTDSGVTFYSHLDGSKHFFSPEKAMQIQHDLGSDIAMAFDECPSGKATRVEVAQAVEKTHKWLKECAAYYKKNMKNQALFGIVQGGIYKDLREKSAKFVAEMDLPGNAIGGVAVGEPLEKSWPMVEAVNEILPKDKPRYLMGVGEPEDLIKAVSLGCDMFDCVLPTRLARHGVIWVKVKGEGFSAKYKKLDLRKANFKQDSKPIDKNCKCPTCTHGFSRSYLHHLTKEKEMLGARLLSLHNLYLLQDLMYKLREDI